MPEEPLREPGGEPELPKEGEGMKPSIEAVPTQKIEAELHPETKEGRYNELLSQLSASAKGAPVLSDTEVASDAKTVSLVTDEESRLQHLLDLAHSKGAVHAVRVARSLQDYYVLDRMHDELSEAFFQKLSEKGLLS